MLGHPFSRFAFPSLAMGYLSCAVSGQIVTNGAPYPCEGTTCASLTNNLSLDVTLRSVTCQLPTSLGHWYDLSQNAELSGNYVTLECVDFSIWSSSNSGNQTIFVRVYQDTTPEDGAPDIASQVLLGEGSLILPPSAEGVASGTPGRTDGDASVAINLPFFGGVLLSPDIAFFVEVGHMGEAVTRFGCNQLGEIGDSLDGSEQTWVKAPICDGGGVVSDDWQKLKDWTPSFSRDFVQRVHITAGEGNDPPSLPFCPADLDRDQNVGVGDLLALLVGWKPGGCTTSRPVGDITPLPNGDLFVDVSDLLALLTAWGPCPNPNAR